MQAAQGTMGRVFVLRLEDGDAIPGSIEQFARDNGVSRAHVSLLGGLGRGTLVVGPEDGDAMPVTAMAHPINAVHEAAAVGTLFPDEAGEPRLHMHAALGRGGETRTGCVRQGLDVWKVCEVVILEIVGTMRRVKDPQFGFELLDLSGE